MSTTAESTARKGTGPHISSNVPKIATMVVLLPRRRALRE